MIEVFLFIVSLLVSWSLSLLWVVLLYFLIMELYSMTRGRCRCTQDLILKKIKI